MNPHRMNKIDISQMSEQDQKAFKMYGKMPAKNLLTKMQKERKYFDSGDYMMSKAGVSPPQPLGTAIPTPEGLPHAALPQNGQLSSSPTNQNAAAFPINHHIERRASAMPNLGGVGMGISPAATSEAMGVPGAGHQRRGSESRISPPGSLREAPASSYPIQHHGSFGSSPVKTSALARRVDEEMEV